MADGIEQWRPVVGFEGYEVSTLGRVRSMARKVIRSNGTPFTVHQRVIRSRPNRKGYEWVHLWVGNKAHIRPIHKLVAEAWLGPRPADKPQVRHLDGNQTNNALGNLAYGSNSENQLDAVLHGTHNMGGKTHCKRGHEFTLGNTYIIPTGKYAGGRACRTCRNMHATALRIRKANSAHQ